MMRAYILAIAAIAAIVWFYTSTGTLHIIAYNIIFVASVSTLLFNGNPLLRFDAYYVLVDLIEHDSDQAGGSVAWGVRNRNEQVVASGVYFYHVVTPDGDTIVKKFTVIMHGGG